MNLVKLRVVTAFNIYRVGDILERIPSVAKVMLKAHWYGRKLVEEVPSQTVAVINPPVIVTEFLPIQNETPPKLTRPEPKYKKRG